jgi:hypothetical protein
MHLTVLCNAKVVSIFKSYGCIWNTVETSCSKEKKSKRLCRYIDLNKIDEACIYTCGILYYHTMLSLYSQRSFSAIDWMVQIR